MTATETHSRPTLKSNLAEVDAHVIEPSEYEELPELSEEILARAMVNQSGRPLSPIPREFINPWLPATLSGMDFHIR